MKLTSQITKASKERQMCTRECVNVKCGWKQGCGLLFMVQLCSLCPISSSSVNMSCAIDYGQIANYDIEVGPRTLVSNMFDRAKKN